MGKNIVGLLNILTNRGTLRYSWGLRLAIFKNLLGLLIEQALGRAGLILCASKYNYSQALEQAQLDAITTRIGNAGLLYIYSGTQPSGPAGADGTLVVGPFTLGSPFAPASSAALPSVLSPTLPSNVNSTTSVQPTWFRVKKSGPGTAEIDGSAATSGADMTMGPPTAGQPVAITSWTITSGNSGH